MTTTALTHHSAATSKTYLQQCVDDLDSSHISFWQCKSTRWRVAAVATYVAFTVLAVGSLAASAVFAPIYIPIIAVSSFFFLKVVNRGHDLFEKWSDQAYARIEQLKAISRHHQELTSATPEQIQHTLFQKGVQWFMIPGMMQSPANLARLKPLIARHNFWEGYVRKLEEKKQAKLIEAAKLSTENYEENKNEIYDLRSEALEIEKRALEGKLKNAFVNAVIRQPTYVGTMDGLGCFSIVSGQERAIGNAASAASVNEFFTFKNGRTPAITVGEVKSMAISDLALRISATM